MLWHKNTWANSSWPQPSPLPQFLCIIPRFGALRNFSRTLQTPGYGPRWSQKDRSLLNELRKGLTPWPEIFRHFPARTERAVCVQLYRCARQDAPEALKTRVKKLSPWCAEERAILNDLRKDQACWPEIFRHFPHRTEMAVRSQMVWLSKRGIVPKDPFKSSSSDHWVPEDYATLMSCRAEGLSWEAVREIFPKRTINALQTRVTYGPPPSRVQRKLCAAWSDEENAQLMQNLDAKNSDLRALAARLGRPIVSVKFKYYKAKRAMLATEGNDLGSKRFWTHDEDMILLNGRQQKLQHKDLIRQLPGRSINGIKGRIQVLCAERLRPKRFSPEEDAAILECRAEGPSLAAISSKLCHKPPRTIGTIVQRLRILQLRRDREATQATAIPQSLDPQD